MERPSAQPTHARGPEAVAADVRPALGGLVRRRRPAVGLRPTVRFAIAFGLTVAYVALCVYVSQPWRSDLAREIGPVMSWVIP